MDRTFTLTLTTASTVYNLYTDLLLNATGAIPTEGYLPNKVVHMYIMSHEDNAAGSEVFVGDALLSATNYAQAMGPSDFFEKGPFGINLIDLATYRVMPSADGLKINVSITAR